METAKKAKQPRKAAGAAKSAPSVKAAPAARVAVKRKAPASGVSEQSEPGSKSAPDQLELLKKQNRELKAELAASKKREAELQSLAGDVTKKLDSVINLIRGLVKP